MSEFSDDADRAALEEQRAIEHALEQQRAARNPGLKVKGACYFCDEPFGENDTRLFCDSDCSADHERLSFQQRQRGIR